MNDRRWDLVSDAVAEHGGMVGTNPDPSSDAGFDFFDLAGLIQEGHVLTPVEPHHDPKPVLESDVEEPARRTRVDPNHVETVRGHLGEVSFHRLDREPLLPGLIYEERAVADAPNPELFFSRIAELSSNRRAPHARRPVDRNF